MLSCGSVLQQPPPLTPSKTTTTYRVRHGLRVERSGEISELLAHPIKGLRRSYKAMQWLLKKAGGGFFDTADSFGPETATALANTSNVPGPHAVALVEAGLRVSYKQFVALARNHVRGFRCGLPRTISCGCNQTSLHMWRRC